MPCGNRSISGATCHIPNQWQVTPETARLLQKEEQSPIRVGYERRNRDLDPQLLWRGKDEQDWSDLVVHAYFEKETRPNCRSVWSTPPM